MDISAATVKTLRDKTGAGMMDCKKALAESGGDIFVQRYFVQGLTLGAIKG